MYGCFVEIGMGECCCFLEKYVGPESGKYLDRVGWWRADRRLAFDERYGKLYN